MEQEEKDFFELQSSMDEIKEDMELLKKCCKLKDKIKEIKNEG